MCPHGGQATPQPAQARVSVAGQPVTTLAHLYPVAGCAFNVAGTPQPCTTVRWTTPASRVRVAGSPVLLSGSTGISQSAQQVPQGSPVTVVVQQRVVGL